MSKEHTTRANATALLSINRVKAFFKTHAPDHNPSEEMFDALAEIPRTIQNILDGVAEPKYFVSPLDVGVGKTVTLSQTLRELDKTGLSAGTVVAAARYTQIEQLIEDMALTEDEYAVYVADGKPLASRGMGKENANSARILFTTHAMIENRLKRDGSGKWADLKELHFHDQPRPLRIWDETLPPGIPITAKTTHVMALARWTERRGEIHKVMSKFIRDIITLEHGGLFEVPDFASIMPLATFGRTLRGADGEVALETATALWAMSGRLVRARSDGSQGISLLTYNGRLPEDMKPMIVLDASARVRALYRHQQTSSEDVVILKAAIKKYEDVEVHIEKGASGKSSVSKSDSERASKVAALINQYDPGRVLVLHHKGRFPRDVLAYKGVAGKDPAFVHWGVHDATNAFKDRDVIILASVYRLPRAVTEATGRAASLIEVTDDYDPVLFREIREGEIMSDTFQGTGRGSLRKMIGDQAAPAIIYAYEDAWTRTGEMLQEIYPGAKVFRDGEAVKPAEIKVTVADRAISAIRDHFEGSEDAMTFADFIVSSGVTKNNIKRTLETTEVSEFMNETGLAVVKQGRSKAISKIGE